MRRELSTLIDTKTACIALLAFFCTGCAGSPQEKDDDVWRYPDGLSHYQSAKPVKLVAQVDAFHYQGAFIDFPNNFIRYHSVDFFIKSPEDFSYSKISLQYQGLPTVNGYQLQLGDKVEFTAPAVVRGSDGDCCAPYLKDLSDLLVISHE